PPSSDPSPSNAFTTSGLTSAAGGDREGSPSRPPLPPLCCGAVREDMPKVHPLPAPLALAGGLRLRRLLATHALQVSSEYLDLITADPQDTNPSSEVIGLWPEHALLNHSCVPSTVSYLDRQVGHLITRITRKGVAAGGELFTNYLGDMVMTPLHIRQASLQQRYGFTCTCPRCKAEAKLDPGLQQLIRDIYESCTDQWWQQVREELEAAVTEGDEEVLAGLCDQLAAYVEVMDAAFHKTQLSERSQVWVQVRLSVELWKGVLRASLHCLYELLYLVLEALGQERDPQLAPLLQARPLSFKSDSLEMACFWARTHLFDAREAEGSQPQRRPGDHQRDRSADRDSLRSSAMAVDKQQLNKLMAAGLSSQAAAVMLATDSMAEVEMQQAPPSLGGHSTRGTSGSGSSRSNSHSSPAPGNAKGQATVGSKGSSKANKRHGNSNGSRSGQGFGAGQATVESQQQPPVEEAEELCLRTYLARIVPGLGQSPQLRGRMAKYGVWMLERLLLRYSRTDGSSRGMRVFVEELLPQLRQSHPELLFPIHTARGHPFLVAYYRNGRCKPVCVRNLDPAAIQDHVYWLRNSHGRGQVCGLSHASADCGQHRQEQHQSTCEPAYNSMHSKVGHATADMCIACMLACASAPNTQTDYVIGKRQLSRNPSIQGVWTGSTFATELEKENTRRLQLSLGFAKHQLAIGQ
ncbi:hypothetical protein QJQ45_022174, partial [Haematococcus lacustris]